MRGTPAFPQPLRDPRDCPRWRGGDTGLCPHALAPTATCDPLTAVICPGVSSEPGACGTHHSLVADQDVRVGDTQQMAVVKVNPSCGFGPAMFTAPHRWARRTQVHVTFPHGQPMGRHGPRAQGPHGHCHTCPCRTNLKPLSPRAEARHLTHARCDPLVPWFRDSVSCASWGTLGSGAGPFWGPRPALPVRPHSTHAP